MTLPRWICLQDGEATVYHSLDEFYDALFDLGVTVPGPDGFVEGVVAWGSEEAS